MNIEYEATFPNINKNSLRIRLKKAGAKLIRQEFMQKRIVFHLPKGHEIKGGWIRVRDEGDKITMSLKAVNGEKIEDQKEVCLKVDSFDQAVLFLESIGCVKKAYQESKRELWMLDNVEITLDEWPFLEPYLEIEGKSETVVEHAAKKLGLDYAQAIFGAVDTLYSQKYNLSSDIISNHTPLIIFSGENPFINRES